MSKIKRHIHEQMERTERDAEGRYCYHFNTDTGKRKRTEDLSSEVINNFLKKMQQLNWN